MPVAKHKRRTARNTMAASESRTLGRQQGTRTNPTSRRPSKAAAQGTKQAASSKRASTKTKAASFSTRNRNPTSAAGRPKRKPGGNMLASKPGRGSTQKSAQANYGRVGTKVKLPHLLNEQ